MPKSFDNGSWTSEYASDKAKSFKPKVMDEVVSFLYKRKSLGATDQELEHELGRPGNTLRPARVQLVKDGVVEDSGHWRFTLARRPAKVWILVGASAIPVRPE